jgi:hypothetical protein
MMKNIFTNFLNTYKNFDDRGFTENPSNPDRDKLLTDNSLERMRVHERPNGAAV